MPKARQAISIKAAPFAPNHVIVKCPSVNPKAPPLVPGMMASHRAKRPHSRAQLEDISTSRPTQNTNLVFQLDSSRATALAVVSEPLNQLAHAISQKRAKTATNHHAE